MPIPISTETEKKDVQATPEQVVPETQQPAGVPPLPVRRKKPEPDPMSVDARGEDPLFVPWKKKDK